MNPIQLFLLRTWILAGEYQWAVFQTVEEAQQVAEQLGGKTEWSAFEYNRDTHTETMFDKTQRYAILSIQSGQLYSAYEG